MYALFENGDFLIDFTVCWLSSFRWSDNISALQCDTMGYTQFNLMRIYQTDGIVQERRNSIANALELRLSCTNPSKWYLIHISRPQLLSDNSCEIVLYISEVIQHSVFPCYMWNDLNMWKNAHHRTSWPCLKGHLGHLGKRLVIANCRDNSKFTASCPGVSLSKLIGMLMISR